MMGRSESQVTARGNTMGTPGAGPQEPDLGDAPLFVVADDEPWARRRLRDLLLARLPDARFVEASDGRRALEAIRQSQPLAAFLDVRMPPPDGLEVARLLRAEGLDTPLVFTTAYGEFALPAFDVLALGYLLKPVDGARLGAVLRRLADLVGPGRDTGPRLLVRRAGGERLSLPLARLCCFEAREKFVLAVARDARYVLDLSLRELEERYGAELLRVHRHTLVLRSRLERLLPDENGRVRVVLRGLETPLSVSRRHLAAVRAALAEGRATASPPT
jgi:two-component system response regulator AlgR